ncbi:hypothetical protein KIN20_020367 [Parelaphostrongylus tenuis]|uniref:Uncharacterized protein n=1 Tax=Parelaphostrongylus tenuis TaxID=148309 RepID=A0AAD5N6G1_PARTN|nr:hypothetical protein KIN20_020367 [Parelaphostrongylus tenuis]
MTINTTKYPKIVGQCDMKECNHVAHCETSFSRIILMKFPHTAMLNYSPSQIEGKTWTLEHQVTNELLQQIAHLYL